jgi:hypothetical protein
VLFPRVFAFLWRLDFKFVVEAGVNSCWRSRKTLGSKPQTLDNRMLVGNRALVDHVVTMRSCVCGPGSLIRCQRKRGRKDHPPLCTTGGDFSYKTRFTGVEVRARYQDGPSSTSTPVTSSGTSSASLATSSVVTATAHAKTSPLPIRWLPLLAVGEGRVVARSYLATAVPYPSEAQLAVVGDLPQHLWTVAIYGLDG